VASYAVHQLTAQRVREVLERDPRLVWPVGTLGFVAPHLPLGAGTRVAEAVADRVCDALGLLRAPTLAFGVAAPDTCHHPGAAAMRRKTFHRALNEVLASWDAGGVREVVVVVYERLESYLEAVLTSLTPEADVTVVDLRTIDVSDLVEDRPELERGGEIDTSLMLHLAPEAVDTEGLVDYETDARTARRYVQGRGGAPSPEVPGVVGHPRRASSETGRLIFERYVETVANALRAPATAVRGGTGLA